MTKLKLEQARKRAEAAKMAYEQTAKMELSKLEDKASVAELEWRIECGFDEKTGLVPGLNDPIFPSVSIKEKSYVTTSSDLCNGKVGLEPCLNPAFKFTDHGVDRINTSEIQLQTFSLSTAIECASNSKSLSVTTPQVTYAICSALNFVEPKYTRSNMSQASSDIDSRVHVVSSKITPVVLQATPVTVSQYKPTIVPQAAPSLLPTVDVVSSPITPVVTPRETQPVYCTLYTAPFQSTPMSAPQGYQANNSSETGYLRQQQTNNTNTDPVPRDHVSAM